MSGKTGLQQTLASTAGSSAAESALARKQFSNHQPSNSQLSHPSNASDLEFSANAASDIAITAIGAALDQKALDVVGLDLKDVSDIADYFVIASGTSDRHIQGIADKLKGELRKIGETPISVSGENSNGWMLIDYGNVVVHIFSEPMRNYYEFDELWKEAKRLPLSPELAKVAKKLRTGIYG